MHAFTRSLKTSPVSFFLIIYCFLASLFIYALWMCHLRLLARNETTNEFLKKTFFTRQGNPFTRPECFSNLRAFLCGSYRMHWDAGDLERYKLLNQGVESEREESKQLDESSIIYS